MVENYRNVEVEPVVIRVNFSEEKFDRSALSAKEAQKRILFRNLRISHGFYSFSSETAKLAI